MKIRVVGIVLLGALSLTACQTTQQAMFDSEQSQVDLRSIQSREFDTSDKELLMRTILATLQDLGFVIDNADAMLGTASATKLDGYALKMTVSVRSKSDTRSIIRANAQFNNQPVTEPKPYQDLFNALSKGLFLEAHEVS